MSESPEERMANNKVYSVDAFAAGIKSNHPEYAEIDNQELVGKMLEKYPQYRSQVDYAPTGGWQDETPKKKDSTELPSAGENKPTDSALPTEAPKRDAFKIIDNDPMELSRLWNRAIAGSETGKIAARSFYGGSIDFEELAYYNKVLNDNAPKAEDWLAGDEENVVGSFLLDIVRTIPESLIGLVDSSISPEAAASAGAGAAAGAAVGTVFAPVTAAAGGAAGAAFAGSGMLTFGSTLLGKIAENGIDITNPKALEAAWNDEELMAPLVKESATKAGIVGSFDALSAGLGGAVAKGVAKTGAKKVAAEIAEYTVEGSLGASGEALGSLAAGDEINWRDVALEGLADPAAGISGRLVKSLSTSLQGKLDADEQEMLNKFEKDPADFDKKMKIFKVENAGVSKEIKTQIEELNGALKTAPKKQRATILKEIQKLEKKRTTLQKESLDALDNMSEEDLTALSTLAEEITELSESTKSEEMTDSQKAAVGKIVEQKSKEIKAIRDKSKTVDEAPVATEEPVTETPVVEEPVAEVTEETPVVKKEKAPKVEKVKKPKEEKVKTPVAEEPKVTEEESKAKLEAVAKVRAAAPKSRYSGVKSRMKSTERGYKTVIEKTDKRTGKVTSYEGDVFVNPKTGKVTHTVTEFVDGKKKGEAKSYKDVKSFRDAINKKIKAGAKEGEAFAREYDASPEGKSAAESARVVEFAEEKTKAPVKSKRVVEKVTYKRDGKVVELKIQVNGSNRQRQLPFATVTNVTEGSNPRRFETKQQYDKFRNEQLARRTDVKVETISETVMEKDAEGVFVKSEAPTEVKGVFKKPVPVTKGTTKTQRKRTTRKPFQAVVHAQVPQESRVYIVRDGKGNDRLFQKTIGKDGEFATYEVEEKTFAGGVKRYEIKEGAKGYDGQGQFLKALREETTTKKEVKAEAPTKKEVETKAEPKKEAPKKKVKPPMNAKSKAQMEAAQKRASELKAMKQENVMLDNGKEYTVYEDGTILNKDTGVEVKPTGVTGKKVLKQQKQELIDAVNAYNKSNTPKSTEKQGVGVDQRIEFEPSEGESIVFYTRMRGDKVLYEKTDTRAGYTGSAQLTIYDTREKWESAIKRAEKKDKKISDNRQSKGKRFTTEEREAANKSLREGKMYDLSEKPFSPTTEEEVNSMSFEELNEAYSGVLSIFVNERFLSKLIDKYVTKSKNTPRKLVLWYQKYVDSSFKQDSFKGYETPVRNLMPLSERLAYLLQDDAAGSSVKAVGEGISNLREGFKKAGLNLDEVARQWYIENIINNKERSQLGSELTPKKRKVLASVAKAKQILKTFAPSVVLIVHETNRSFNDAMAKNSVNGASNVKEGGRFIQNKNTNIKEIHINLENATETTAVHEAFHAFFDNAYAQDPKTANALANRLYSALKRGSKQDKQIAKKLNEFKKRYSDPNVQSEEMLAELAGIMSEAENVLSRPTLKKLADIIKDFIIRLAKKLNIDNRIVRLLEFDANQRADENLAVEFMKGFVNAVEESSANPLENPLSSMPRFKSQDLNLSDLVKEMSELTEDYNTEIGGFKLDFYQNTKIIKKAIKSGQITTGHKMSELNDKMFIMHQPDNAAVNVIKDQNGNVVAQTLGGFLFPLKFDGAFWASTRSAAEKMASDLNSMLALNGKIRMVLTAAPKDKMMSSTVAARNVQSIVDNYAERIGWSEKNKLSYQRKRYDLSVRMFEKYSLLNQKQQSGAKLTSTEKQTLGYLKSYFSALGDVGLINTTQLKNGKIKLIKKKFKTSEEYNKLFSEVKDADVSAFPVRKELSDVTIGAFVKSLSDSNRAKMTEFGYSKRVTKKEVKDALIDMMTEPYVGRIESGMAYAVIEADGVVEAVEMKGEGSHPSYPYQIKLADSSKSVAVKILDNPENPFSDANIYDVSKDNEFNVGEYIKTPEQLESMSEKDRSFFNKVYKDFKDIVYPSSGITQMIIRNPSKNTINNINDNIYSKVASYKNIESYKKSREDNKNKYADKKRKIQERSQLSEDEKNLFDSQESTETNTNLFAKLKSRKGLRDMFEGLGQFAEDKGLVFTDTQKKVRTFLESMNSQLSFSALAVRKHAARLRKLTKTPEALAEVRAYITESNPEAKQAIAERIEKMPKGDAIIATADSMRAMIDNLSQVFLDNPMFDSLPEKAFKEVQSYKSKEGKTMYRVVNTKTGGIIDSDLTKAAAEKVADAPSIKDAIRANLGSYLHTSYRFFSSKEYKITDKAKRKAYEAEYEVAKMSEFKKLIKEGKTQEEALDILKQPATINRLIDEATESINKYVSEIEAMREDPDFVFTGLSANSIKIPKTALQQKKGIPEHIAELLGREKDPVNSFIDTAMVMHKTIFKTQMVKKISDAFGGDFVKDEVTEAEINSGNWKKVKDQYSPINGKYVKTEIFEMLQSKPLLQAENAVLNAYFKGLKVMRKSKVVWNLPTWRKNLTGGMFFIAANGVMNPAFLKDFKNRIDRTRKGEANPEIESLLKEMSELGLIGADVNAGLIDVNDAAMNVLFDEDFNGAEAHLKKVWTKVKNTDAKLAEKYAAIDDYTKLIIYRVERESFAKKLYGKDYASLTEAQQTKVRDEAGEFVKQNTPTFSRLPKWYINSFSKVPLGDFLGFKLESWRSITANLRNATADIKKSSDQSLSEVQRKEYLAAGRRRMMGSIATLGARAVVPAILTSMFLGDDDEEIAEDALAIRPDWMEGHSLIVKNISDDGVVSVYNYSMEDPYGEISDALMGDLTGFADFMSPNMFVKLAVHLTEGRDAYGRDLYDKSDPAASKFAKIMGYTTKSMIMPPSLVSTAKYQENQMLIRDYKYNLGQQFYFTAREYTKGKPYNELKGRARTNRLEALDDVKMMYDSVLRVAQHKGNASMMVSANKVLNRFNKIERAYIRGGFLIEE